MENSEAVLAPSKKPETCEKHGAYMSMMFLGRWTLCPKCSEDRMLDLEREARVRFAADMLARSTDRAQIPARFRSASFDSYKADTSAQAEALGSATRYVTALHANVRTGRSLVMSGKVGTGKTHLACAILLDAINRGMSARYTTAAAMVREIRSTWGGEGDEAQVMREFTQPQLLVIDEVGMQHGSESELTLISEVIDKRYQQMLPQIIVSNLPVRHPSGPSIETAIGSRALDRLRDGGELVVFNWDSYRGAKQ